MPELLEGFFKQVAAGRVQVEAKQIAEPEILYHAEVLAATEQQPAGLPEHNIAALPFQTTCFLGTDVIQGLVHIGDDMKAVEDVQSLGTVFANELQMAS